MKLATYKKFLVVRDPLERLYSAYRNKFSSNSSDSKAFKKNYAARMIKETRGEEVGNGDGLVFEVFKLIYH